MNEEFMYDGDLIKGDLIEIYAKTIANLGPFNSFFPKEFSYSSNGNGGGMTGFTLSGFGKPHFAYIARQIMDVRGPVGECMMERSSLPRYFFGGDFGRRIVLENIEDGGIRAEVEDSRRGVMRVKRVLDQVLGREIEPWVQEVADEFNRRNLLKRMGEI